MAEMKEIYSTLPMRGLDNKGGELYRQSFIIGDGQTTEFVLNHNQNSYIVDLEVETAELPRKQMYIGWEKLNMNSIKLYFPEDNPPAVDEIRATIVVGEVGQKTSKQEIPFGDGVSLIYELEHELNDPYPIIQIIEVATQELISCGIKILSSSRIKLDFDDPAPTIHQYVCVLQSMITPSGAISMDAIFNRIYPVGSIYQNSDFVDPNDLFFGSWERIKGVALVGVDEDDPTFATSRARGGHKDLQQHTHTNTVGNQSANHTHSGTSGVQSANHTHAFGHTHTYAHTHGMTSSGNHTHTTNFWGHVDGSGQIYGHPINNTSWNFTGNATEIRGGGDHSHTTNSQNVTTTSGASITTTSGISANHTHAMTTDANSTNHNHVVTINNAGTGTAGNLSPYETVYIWRRVA